MEVYYEFCNGFYMLLSFLAGYFIAKMTPFYIGHDEEKYNKASCGILLR